ncbi:hypothetical protein Tco_0517557 [Tanacetum coccineum]
MYDKMEYCEDEDECFTNFETKFPAIVLDNTLTSDAAISCGPTEQYGDLAKTMIWEVSGFDGPGAHLYPIASLDVSPRDVIGPEPPIKPHSLDGSRMKVVDYLTTQTPPSPHVENSYPKSVYSYYNPGIDDHKRHYGFKLGLLGKSVSLGVDISNWEMFDDDWRLESKEVLGEELSLFDRKNEVERGRILEAHSLFFNNKILNVWFFLITVVIFDEKKLGSS